MDATYYDLFVRNLSLCNALVHRRRNEIKDMLKPGHMIPAQYDPKLLSDIRSTWLNEVLYAISCSKLVFHVMQWIEYWDMTRVYLVEKSPQSMLKSSLYRDLFKHAKSIKFLILIKVSFSTPCKRR